MYDVGADDVEKLRFVGFLCPDFASFIIPPLFRHLRQTYLRFARTEER